MLWHNHPSGDPTPSEDDMAITERMRSAAEIIGVGMRDHVIRDRGALLGSFKEHGRLG